MRFFCGCFFLKMQKSRYSNSSDSPHRRGVTRLLGAIGCVWLAAGMNA